MGFIDKLKNVFFEEVEDDEEQEVEEKPLKLAKKIEFPKRKEREIEKNEAEDNGLFKEEKVVPTLREEIAVKEEIEVDTDVAVVDDVNSKIPMMFEEEDFVDNSYSKEIKEEYNHYTREERYEKKELYQGKKEPSYVESVSKPYANTSAKSYYENKESKGFKPSPIISPIYGVLDKNYRKEEVVTKKEVKPASNSYRNVDLDSVRNKAFGKDNVSDESKKETKKIIENKVEKKKDDKTLYDVNKSKPDVDKITLADADEYYNDLGLAYNVDYNDTSRNKANTRTKRYHEDKDDSNENSDSNDNLFDLIDLMYNKED